MNLDDWIETEKATLMLFVAYYRSKMEVEGTEDWPVWAAQAKWIAVYLVWRMGNLPP